MEKASFGTQANALLRKNVAFQKRNVKGNLRIVLFPVVLCLLLILFQKVIDNALDKPENRCGCACVETRGDGSCLREECGLRYSTSLEQVFSCPIPSPPPWPPLLQVPPPHFRAAASDGTAGLPPDQCRTDGTCPATTLLTGASRPLALDVAAKFFDALPIPPPRNISAISSTLVLGSDTKTRRDNFVEPGYLTERPLYVVQPSCRPDFSISFPIRIAKDLPKLSVELQCVRGLSLWRNSSSAVNDELYAGYRQSNSGSRINEIMAAYDFLDTSKLKFNARIWYNSTSKNNTIVGSPPGQIRVVLSVNLISNAYIKHLKGNGFEMKLGFIKEMPKAPTTLELDFSSLLGPLFFKWVIELIFPVLLTYLIYEKQYKLRIMMKMHGLGDGPYWIISYAYFLLISIVYILFLVIFGSLIGLRFFTMQDYSLQFVFYFSFINLQIALAFFVSTFFKNVRNAQDLS